MCCVQYGTVLQNSYAYYQFDLPDGHQGLLIRVNAISGRATLFVNNNGMKPTATNYQWGGSTYVMLKIAIFGVCSWL